MPSKKKKYNARFPPARIKKIMQTDDEIGKVAAPVPVIISRALELFAQSLIMKTNCITQARNAKTLSTSHIKQCIMSESKFDFLKDLVASVPDVQTDDDTGQTIPLSSSATNANIASLPVEQHRAINQHRRTRGRSQKSPRNNSNRNAGPSVSGTEGSDNDDDEDDDDECDENEEEDDDENSNSQTSSTAQSLTGLSSTATNPTPPQMPLSFSIAPSTSCNDDDDDDYDS